MALSSQSAEHGAFYLLETENMREKEFSWHGRDCKFLTQGEPDTILTVSEPLNSLDF